MVGEAGHHPAVLIPANDEISLDYDLVERVSHPPPAPHAAPAAHLTQPEVMTLWIPSWKTTDPHPLRYARQEVVCSDHTDSWSSSRRRLRWIDQVDQPDLEGLARVVGSY